MDGLNDDACVPSNDLILQYDPHNDINAYLDIVNYNSTWCKLWLNISDNIDDNIGGWFDDSKII